MLEALKALDFIRLNFSQDTLFILNIALAFIMFGVALEIKTEHFKELSKRPKSVLTGILSQFILLPSLTFLITIALHEYITPSIALGMILVASCPGGNISNFMSNMAKGNVALSVSLTAFATFTATVFTPFNFAFWGKLYIQFIQSQDANTLLRPLEISTFDVFQTVAIILGIPLVLGMFISYKYPKLTQKIIKPIKQLSVVIFAVIVLIAFKNNYQHFLDHIHYVFLLVLLHNLVALFSGFSVSTLFKVPRHDRRTITIETGIQNSGLGLVLLFNPNIFPADLPLGGMATITAWWGIWHIISGLTIAWFWSNNQKLQSLITAK
ncbi:bile acid:sodium symporter family protein [Sediminitomix flava]|uniref:BASS family bile acid:Na+ symporter n=1 Tax=Sediminitomix flava TaxID=379075 RepID=A0A315ZYT8_SEDFL|nr:bile acid:sodium symporter family protein [Sediminitomix flava]PWJ42537.1 BASS family bile acid:Na+ symporter [Sediminitomix flava]